MRITSLLRFLVAGLVLGTTAVQALAQTFPNKPVNMVVPWPAGGPSDFVARKLQPDMAKSLGQPVIVDNVGGVGGALGIQKTASAAADGHTIALASPLELIVAPLTVAAVKYKSEDLKIVAQIVKAPIVLLARKDFPANNVDELLQMASRSGAKELSIANGGNGSLFHLIAEKFGQQLGTNFVHVPYKGTAPMISDLMGGQVDMAFTVFGGNIPTMVTEGKLKAIGVTSRGSLPKFPNLAVLGAHPKLSGFEFDSWASIVVPRNTPDAVANRLNKVVYDALQNADSRGAFEATGNTVVAPTSVAELDRLHRQEIARYQAIVRSIKFEPQ